MSQPRGFRLPDCLTCKHYEKGTENRGACAAFPEGIPREIMLGWIHHKEPVEGDHGIVYEEDPKHPVIKLAKKAADEKRRSDNRLFGVPNPRKLIKPQCESCKHFKGNYACAAFPNGIPIEILINKFDHKQEFQGDGGIRFEQRKDLAGNKSADQSK